MHRVIYLESIKKLVLDLHARGYSISVISNTIKVSEKVVTKLIK